jgi:hypothetical protein
MTPQNWKDVTAGIQSVVTAAALLGGGWWALARFWREREGALRIQFDLAVRFIGYRVEIWLVELIATLENKGKIRHKIKEFTFQLSYLTSAGEISSVDASKLIVPFQNIAASGSWLSKNWLYTFVEPGVKQSFTVVTTIPEEALYLYLSARFDYAGGSEFHESDWTGKVPSLRKS